MRTNRIARLAFPFLATSLLAVAPACDKDEDLNADFAKATHEQRQIAVSVGSGETASAALFLTMILGEFGEEGGCPKVTRDGDKVTIKGGCSIDGGRIDGSATLEIDESSGELSATWDNFTLTEEGTLRIDGSVTITEKNGGGVIDANLDFEAEGKGGKLDGALTCDASEKCTPEAETVIEVKGLGGAGVKGTWSTGDEDEGVRSGAIELHGKNVLKVDFSKQDAQGCYVTTVDGAAVQSMCDQTEEEDDFAATAKRAAASFQARATR